MIESDRTVKLKQYEIPIPFYYLGWIIQIHPERQIFAVYDRVDRPIPLVLEFKDFGEACKYVAESAYKVDIAMADMRYNSIPENEVQRNDAKTFY